MPWESYPKRTAKNVQDSDGTLIVTHGRLTGGSAFTRECASKAKRPRLHIDLNISDFDEAADQVKKWIEKHNIMTLNVAGPRGSKDPKIYQDTMTLLKMTISR